MATLIMMIKAKCEVCNIEFSVPIYRKDKAKYCSFACRNKAYKGKHFSIKTEFKKGQKFSKERNLKVSESNKGRIPANKGKRRSYEHICKYCKEEFIDKRQHNTICPKKGCQTKKYVIKNINKTTEILRRKKISRKLKGKMPLNLRRNIKYKSSPRQKTLFRIIKKYFPSARYNYLVKTNTRRYLDIAIPELKLDFEYNGKCHLLKSIIENDKKRTEELTELGWRIVVFDRNNFDEAEIFIKKLMLNLTMVMLNEKIN